MLVTVVSCCVRQAGRETGYAHGHLDYLKDVGEMLQAAARGAPRDYIGMYPGMAKAERAHAGRFQQALDDVA